MAGGLHACGCALSRSVSYAWMHSLVCGEFRLRTYDKNDRVEAAYGGDHHRQSPLRRAHHQQQAQPASKQQPAGYIPGLGRRLSRPENADRDNNAPVPRLHDLMRELARGHAQPIDCVESKDITDQAYLG